MTNKSALSSAKEENVLRKAELLFEMWIKDCHVVSDGWCTAADNAAIVNCFARYEVHPVPPAYPLTICQEDSTISTDAERIF